MFSQLVTRCRRGAAVLGVAAAALCALAALPQPASADVVVVHRPAIVHRAIVVRRPIVAPRPARIVHKTVIVRRRLP